jgi:alkylglycerol monooxygenase
MEQYGKILVFAMPLFLVMVLFERWYGWKRGKDTYQSMDMISSLSSGITNVVKDVLGLSVSLIAYGWFVDRVSIFHVESSIWTYCIAFVAFDFSGYWVHRLSHEVNFFWNKHAIHHSSESFNLACALRQSVSSFVNLFTVFLLPAALLGVPESVMGVVAPIHLFAQFWYHTQHINRMGWLEYILVTPSHHRVHHAINPEYMDKNHGQIFIFWDKLFGTFQEELASVPPVYGITRPARTWNPIKINFQHLLLLIKDAWRTASWSDKLRIWFMPTGWRPEDVSNHFPVAKIEDPYNFEAYTTELDIRSKTWAHIQLIWVFLITLYFFSNLVEIGVPAIFVYGIFIFISVYSYTEQMDLNPRGWLWELFKNSMGLLILITTGDWFSLSNVFWFGPHIVGFYLIASTILSWHLRSKAYSGGESVVQEA